MIADSGSNDQLDILIGDLDFAYIKVGLGQGEYSVDHYGAMALIDSSARVRDYFLPMFDVEGLTADRERFLASSQ